MYTEVRAASQGTHHAVGCVRQQFQHEALQSRPCRVIVHAVEQATSRVVAPHAATSSSSWKRWQPQAAGAKRCKALRGVQRRHVGRHRSPLKSATCRASRHAPPVHGVPRACSCRSTRAAISRNAGGITRTGNRHARRILVESAWSYRFRPAYEPTRSGDATKGLPAPGCPGHRLEGSADRLHRRYKRLLGRGQEQATDRHCSPELAGSSGPSADPACGKAINQAESEGSERGTRRESSALWAQHAPDARH